jgi:hypothetical protein
VRRRRFLAWHGWGFMKIGSGEMPFRACNVPLLLKGLSNPYQTYPYRMEEYIGRLEQIFHNRSMPISFLYGAR